MLIRRILTLGLMLTLASGTAAPAAAAAQGSVLDAFLRDVRKTTLPNGLTVLTREQKGTGVVAITTWVKAGYFHEPDEVAGMAHLFEHMFFKGSRKFPGAEQISQELSKVGGQTNAGTIYDSTNYYFVLPRQGFLRGMEIQADAIANPLFDPAELKKEAEVVIEESNRKLDNPPAVSAERMFATAFTQHRMKRWRIGSNEVLRSIRRDNLVAFFETLYRPGNIILSIAGDVSHAEALDAARRTFGTIPKGTLDKRRGPTEPPQTRFRFGQSSADVKQGYSVLGWHTPGVGHADEVALEALAAVLGQGRSSRLYRAVVAPDAATTIEASLDSFEDVGLLTVQASFDEANRARVDRRTLGEVERLRAHGPTGYELQLAKNRIESALVLDLQSVLGQSQALALAESRYGYAGLATRLQALARLTPAQVQAVARTYLTPENLTLYHYRPNGTPDIGEPQALEAVRAALADPQTAPAPVPLPAVAAPVRAAQADLPPQQLTLSNGATLIVRERPGAPVVSTGIYFRGGSVNESSANAGITQLMTRVMRKGTASRSGEQIDREAEFLGSQIATDQDADSFGFTLDVLAKNFRPGVALLADVVSHPVFPEQGLAEERHLQVGAIRRSFDSSAQRPFELAFRDLWGSHPYALPQAGTIESVQALEAAALRAWWERSVTAAGAVVVVVGDVAAADARTVLEAELAQLPARKAEWARPPALPQPAARLETIEYRDRKQSAIAMAFPTVPASHADWPRLRLIGNVTSGLGGTFFAELRGRRSLAYTVYARDASRKEAGVFVAYMATDASKEEEARTALLGEIRRLQADGITQADVDRAKAFYAGATRIRLQTNAALLDEYAGNYLNGLGLDWTEKLLERTAGITLDELKAVAAQYLGQDRFVTAVVRGKP